METFNLGLPHNFSFQSTVYSHGWIDLAPFAYDPDRRILAYHIIDPTGQTLQLAVEYSDDHSLQVQYDKGIRSYIKKVITRIFRLDEDLSGLYKLADESPQLRWIADKSVGRLLRSGSLWEDLIKMICTTNCSWVMTRNMITNLIIELSPGKAFPTPEMVAACDESFLRKKVKLGYRAPYISELAGNIIEERLDLEAIENWDGNDETLYRQLLQIKGIGPYAAGSLLKLLGFYRHPAPDSWSRKKFMQIFSLSEVPTDSEIEKHYQSYASWAGLVFWLEMTKDWYFRS